MAETAAAIVAVKVADLVPCDRRKPLDDELSDTIATFHPVIGIRISVDENHFQLPTVRTVDQPRRVSHRNAVFECHTRTRHDEPAIAIGNRNRHTGSDEHPPPTCRDRGRLPGEQIKTSVAPMGVAGKFKVGVETNDVETDVIAPTRHTSRHVDDRTHTHPPYQALGLHG